MTKSASKHQGFVIVNPDANIKGETVSQWTEEWMKWAFYSPADSNPVYGDTTGEYAHVNNDGPIFYVAGADLGSDVERSFTVPPGKPVLFPIINNWIVDAPRGTDPVRVCPVIWSWG